MSVPDISYARDLDATKELMRDYYTDLQRLNRNQELLSLIEIDSKGFRIVKRAEFDRRFQPDNFDGGEILRLVLTFGNYVDELKDAVKRELNERLRQNKPLELGDRVRVYI